MDYRIYAVDFDGTLCEGGTPNNPHYIGEPNTKLIEHLKKEKAKGNKLILWTCREGARLKEAVQMCKEHGLVFDALNDNLPDPIKIYGENTRKVFAHEYIDDKANQGKYNIPFVADKNKKNEKGDAVMIDKDRMEEIMMEQIERLHESLKSPRITAEEYAVLLKELRKMYKAMD